MKDQIKIQQIVTFLLLLVVPVPAYGAEIYDTSNDSGSTANIDYPNKQHELQAINKVGLTVTNYGTIGTGYIDNPICDGEPCPSCEYPKNSDLEYLFYSGIWIGAIVGSDTLVSVAGDGWFHVLELFPDAGYDGEIVTYTNRITHPEYHPDAVSEWDILCTYYDTLKDGSLIPIDPIDNRPHVPLNVKIKQSCYGWSYADYEDFVTFKYDLQNIGPNPLENVWIGIYVDGDVYHNSNNATGYQDDVSGFLDQENIAYIMDNDGDPDNDWNWSTTSTRSVMGIKFHGSNQPIDHVNFNWWVSNGAASLDFGPRLAGTAEAPFRSFGAHLGTPTGDKNKYYILSHPEVDYDQLFTAISHTAEGFLPPPYQALATDIANGFDTRCLISFGPFNIAPDSTVTFGYSVVMGSAVHVNPVDFADFFYTQNPLVYYDLLDFSDLISNADRADNIYNSLVTAGYECGDVNGDFNIGVSDIGFLIEYYFGNGPAPIDPSLADLNCDGLINLSDIILLFNFVFDGMPLDCCF